MKYLVVGSNLKLTSELIDKIDDTKNYAGIVIRGQRPWTEDATYLKENLGKEMINIPYKIRTDEEILNDIDQRRPSPTSNLLAIALSFASSPEMMEMLNMDKMFRGLLNYPKVWEPQDKYLAIPKQKFHSRKPFDKRNQIRRR